MTQSIMAGWVWSVTGSGSVRASLSRRAQEVVRLDGGRNLAKLGETMMRSQVSRRVATTAGEV